MVKPKLFLSPCGTSLLTNSIPNLLNEFTSFVTLNDLGKMRTFITGKANLSEDEMRKNYPTEYAEFTKYVENRQAYLLSDDRNLQEVQDMSAELNTLITYYEGILPKNGADYHYLLCTDTYQGQITANMVKAWLNKYKINADIKTFRGLKADNADCFRAAMSDLVDWCNKISQEWRKKDQHKIIFNLTGGFKSVQGFLQTIGMFYADEILYIFQSSKELLRIPRLPITLDGNAKKIVEENLNIVRLLAMGKHLPVNEFDNKNVLETVLLEKVDDQVVLSTWGELIWNQLKSDFYQKELLPPLNPKIIYSQEVEKKVKSLNKDRLELINQRLDDLCQHLDNPSYNPKSLSFKQIKGNAMKGITHEFYAWSDQDAKRFYGHFEGSNFIIDQLGKHL